MCLAYGDQEVFTNLSFAIDKGEFLVVLGENGVGKTTLIRALLGQLKPRRGAIKLAAGTRIGYVPQFRNLDREYPLSVRDFVALNLPPKPWPFLTGRERQRVTDLLDATDLTKIAQRPLGRASGGEKQRAYLAQALMQKPQLLILDESTASLDNEMKYDLLNLVERFRKRGVAVLFVTHDWGLARRYGTSYLHLTPGGYSTGKARDLPGKEGA